MYNAGSMFRIGYLVIAAACGGGDAGHRLVLRGTVGGHADRADRHLCHAHLAEDIGVGLRRIAVADDDDMPYRQVAVLFHERLVSHLQAGVEIGHVAGHQFVHLAIQELTFIANLLQRDVPLHRAPQSY